MADLEHVSKQLEAILREIATIARAPAVWDASGPPGKSWRCRGGKYHETEGDAASCFGDCPEPPPRLRAEPKPDPEPELDFEGEL